MEKLRTGALYIRVSTADQAELSPDAQKRLLLEYAKKNHIIIGEDFIYEESVSGRHAQKRPKFQEMIAMAKSLAHPIDVILVWKYSRFARNQEESIVYKSMLKRDHVDVISVSEPLIDGPFGSLIERIIEWMDEYYSIRLSGEVLRGMKEKALRNGYQSVPSLGYQAVGKGKPFIINKDEIEIIKFVMDSYDNKNLDPSGIARRCNAMGYRTKRGNLFERRTIERILRNPFYAGTVAWNGVEFEGDHETIISKEQYNNRIKLMDARKKTQSHDVSTCRHWLSGLVKCSTCGASLGHNTAKTPFFQCWKYAKGYHDGSCYISERKLERMVLQYFEDILNGKEFTYKSRADKATINNDELTFLKHELDKIDTKESRVKDAYENEIDSLEEYKENKERLNKQRDEIKDKIEVIKEKNVDNPVPKEEALKEIKNVYEILKDPTASYEVKGNFIRSIVDKIVFDRKKCLLFFDINL